MAGHWKLDETSGTTATDSSGNGNNGTLQNGPVWQPTGGCINGALQFDGVDDRVDCGNASRLKRYKSDFTIAAWVKLSAYQNSWMAEILSNRGSGRGSMFCVRGEFDATNQRKIVFDAGRGGTRWIYGTTQLALNTWHHIAVTFKYNGGNHNTAVVYVNGNAENTISSMSDVADPVENTYIGHSPPPPPTALWGWSGLIDDVRIYNRVLSGVEVCGLYSSGLPPETTTTPTAGSTTTTATTGGSTATSTVYRLTG